MPQLHGRRAPVLRLQAERVIGCCRAQYGQGVQVWLLSAVACCQRHLQQHDAEFAD